MCGSKAELVRSIRRDPPFSAPEHLPPQVLRCYTVRYTWRYISGKALDAARGGPEENRGVEAQACRGQEGRGRARGTGAAGERSRSQRARHAVETGSESRSSDQP